MYENCMTNQRPGNSMKFSEALPNVNKPVGSYVFINQFLGKSYNQFETAQLIRGQEMGEFNWSQPKVNHISVLP